MKINTVTVVGANGNMGSNVSGLIASFGSAKVFLVSRKIEDSKKAIEKICSSIRTDDIRKNLVAKSYDDLEECVAQSDWIFESVAEDIELKKKITTKIFRGIKDTAVVTTGTSGLSLTEIVSSLPEEQQSRYFGTHFFNPPYNLSLCELIDTDSTNKELFVEFSSYLATKLFRTVVYSKDRPAFLANRVGFQFINRAVLLAEELKDDGGIDFVDYLLQGVTGRGMPPLVTADFVGLDIHQAIIKNLLDNADDYENKSFMSPDYLNKLIGRKHLGVKTKIGFYKTEISDGKPKKLVYDIATDEYREITKYESPLIEDMKKLIQVSEYEQAFSVLNRSDSKEADIIKKILVDHVIYSIFVSNEVSEGISSINDALVSGFNWIAPSDLINLLGGPDTIKEIYINNSIPFKNKLSLIELESILNKLDQPIIKSKYDYRKYIKA